MSRMATFATLVIAIVVSACGANPEQLATQFQEAINSGDVDTAISLLADGAMLQIDGTSTLTSSAEIENWMSTQAKLRLGVEGTPMASDAGVVFEDCSISSDQWAFLRVNPMSGVCEVELEGGLITRFTVQFDEDSKARLSESGTGVSADLVGIWTGSAIPPEGPPFRPSFLQFFEDGSARFAFSPGDLSIAPDTDHPGVLLKWTYEEDVLTLQNQGPAMEGYCQEQDVGMYLFKRTEDGGIQLKSISDPCLWRETILVRRGLDWDAYTP